MKAIFCEAGVDSCSRAALAVATEVSCVGRGADSGTGEQADGCCLDWTIENVIEIPQSLSRNDLVIFCVCRRVLGHAGRLLGHMCLEHGYFCSEQTHDSCHNVRRHGHALAGEIEKHYDHDRSSVLHRTSPGRHGRHAHLASCLYDHLLVLVRARGLDALPPRVAGVLLLQLCRLRSVTQQSGQFVQLTLNASYLLLYKLQLLRFQQFLRHTLGASLGAQT